MNDISPSAFEGAATFLLDKVNILGRYKIFLKYKYF
jgi:hypothetical protein